MSSKLNGSTDTPFVPIQPLNLSKISSNLLYESHKSATNSLGYKSNFDQSSTKDNNSLNNIITNGQWNFIENIEGKNIIKESYGMVRNALKLHQNKQRGSGPQTIYNTTMVSAHSTSICHPGLDALLNKTLHHNTMNHSDKLSLDRLFTKMGQSNKYGGDSLFTIEQLELIRRLKKTGVKHDQISEAFTIIDKLEKELNGLFDYTLSLFPQFSKLNQISQAPLIDNADTITNKCDGMPYFFHDFVHNRNSKSLTNGFVNGTLGIENCQNPSDYIENSSGTMEKLKINASFIANGSASSDNRYSSPPTSVNNETKLELSNGKISDYPDTTPHKDDMESISFNKDLNYLLSLPIYSKYNDFLKFYNQDVYKASNDLKNNGSSNNESNDEIDKIRVPPNSDMTKNASTTAGGHFSTDVKISRLDVNFKSAADASFHDLYSLPNVSIDKHKHTDDKIYSSNSIPKSGWIGDHSPMALYQLLMRKIVTSTFIKEQKDILVNALLQENNLPLNIEGICATINNAMAIATFFAAMILTSTNNNFYKMYANIHNDTNNTDNDISNTNNNHNNINYNGTVMNGFVPINQSPLNNVRFEESKLTNGPPSTSSNIFSNDVLESIMGYTTVNSTKISRYTSNTTCIDYNALKIFNYLRSYNDVFSSPYPKPHFLNPDYFQNKDPWSDNCKSSFPPRSFRKISKSSNDAVSGLFQTPNGCHYNAGTFINPINFDFTKETVLSYPNYIQTSAIKDRLNESNSSANSTIDSDNGDNRCDPSPDDKLVENDEIQYTTPNDSINENRIRETNLERNLNSTLNSYYGEKILNLENNNCVPADAVAVKFKSFLSSKILHKIGRSENFSVERHSYGDNGAPVDSNEGDIEKFARKGRNKCAEIIKNFLNDNSIEINHVSLFINQSPQQILAFLHDKDDQSSEGGRYSLYRWYIMEKKKYQKFDNSVPKSSPSLVTNHFLTQGTIKRKIHDIMENLYGNTYQAVSSFYPIYGEDFSQTPTYNTTYAKKLNNGAYRAEHSNKQSSMMSKDIFHSDSTNNYKVEGIDTKDEKVQNQGCYTKVPNQNRNYRLEYSKGSKRDTAKMFRSDYFSNLKPFPAISNMASDGNWKHKGNNKNTIKYVAPHCNGPNRSKSSIIVSSCGVGQTYKRERFTFKSGHLEILENFFREDAYPDSVRREYIAETCNTAMTRLDGRELLPRERVTTHVVANWFANRRKESRRQKKNKDGISKDERGNYQQVTPYNGESTHHKPTKYATATNDKTCLYKSNQLNEENVYKFTSDNNDFEPTFPKIKLKSEPEESIPCSTGLGTDTCTKVPMMTLPIPGATESGSLTDSIIKNGKNLDEEMAAVNTTIMALVNQHAMDEKNLNGIVADSNIC